MAHCPRGLHFITLRYCFSHRSGIACSASNLGASWASQVSVSHSGANSCSQASCSGLPFSRLRVLVIESPSLISALRQLSKLFARAAGDWTAQSGWTLAANSTASRTSFGLVAGTSAITVKDAGSVIVSRPEPSADCSRVQVNRWVPRLTRCPLETQLCLPRFRYNLEPRR